MGRFSICHEGLEDKLVSADRWEAIMRCDRVRVLGHANLGNSGQHIGFELWDNYPPGMLDAKAEKMNREALTTFADAVVKYKSKS